MNFKVIDLTIGTVSGIIIALTAMQIIPGHWNMLSGMLAGGLIGMFIKFILLLLLAPFFGAFEVMIPLSIIAMVVGMAAGMAATLGLVSVEVVCLLGGAIGFSVAGFVYRSNQKLTQFK